MELGSLRMIGSSHHHSSGYRIGLGSTSLGPVWGRDGCPHTTIKSDAAVTERSEMALPLTMGDIPRNQSGLHPEQDSLVVVF